MPHPRCPMPHAHCPIAPCPIAPSPSPHAPLPHTVACHHLLERHHPHLLPGTGGLPSPAASTSGTLQDCPGPPAAGERRSGAGERRSGAGERSGGAGERRSGAGERRSGAGERRSGAGALEVFPRLLHLPLELFKIAQDQLLQGSPHTPPPLTAVELMTTLHAVQPKRDNVPLKKRAIYTQQVIAKVLNQLASFVADILSRLITKQVWRAHPQLWLGFIKCCLVTKPLSFPVLLQVSPLTACHFSLATLTCTLTLTLTLTFTLTLTLPSPSLSPAYPSAFQSSSFPVRITHPSSPLQISTVLPPPLPSLHPQLPAAQLEDALNREPSLRPDLAAHAAQPSVQPSVPRYALRF
ncbi:unnamed protein product [Closterium sp. NIES-54]